MWPSPPVRSFLHLLAVTLTAILIGFLGLFALSALWIVFAQAPAAPATPALDASDKMAIEMVVTAEQLMQKACADLEVYKHYEQSRKYLTTVLGAKYPQQTLDWTTKRLVQKPAAK